MLYVNSPFHSMSLDSCPAPLTFQSEIYLILQSYNSLTSILPSFITCVVAFIRTLCSYSVGYVEDSEGIYPFNTSGFTVTDDDSVFLYQATLTAGILVNVGEIILKCLCSIVNVILTLIR